MRVPRSACSHTDPLNAHGSLTSRIGCLPCQSHLSVLGRRAKCSVKRRHEGIEESAQRWEACRSPPRSAYETEKVRSGVPSHPVPCAHAPTLSHTFHLSARFDRPNRPMSLHNPFHSRRALYSRSDWFAVTDSVDHCFVFCPHPRPHLARFPFIGHVDLVLNSVDLFSPLDAIDGSLPFRQLTIEEGTSNIQVPPKCSPHIPVCFPLASYSPRPC